MTGAEHSELLSINAAGFAEALNGGIRIGAIQTNSTSRATTPPYGNNVNKLSLIQVSTTIHHGAHNIALYAISTVLCRK